MALEPGSCWGRDRNRELRGLGETSRTHSPTLQELCGAANHGAQLAAGQQAKAGKVSSSSTGAVPARAHPSAEGALRCAAEQGVLGLLPLPWPAQCSEHFTPV